MSEYCIHRAILFNSQIQRVIGGSFIWVVVYSNVSLDLRY